MYARIEERRRRRAQQRRTARASGLATAPGELEIVQAFVNTTACDQHPELLASSEDLTHWLRRRELLGPDISLNEAQWHRTLSLRGDLRSLILAGGRQEGVDPKLLRNLERAASGGRLVVRFDDAGPSGFGIVAADFDGALTTMVAIVAVARLEDVWSRLEVCSRSQCGRVFFARRRGRAAWCTTRCGERARAARRRARRK